MKAKPIIIIITTLALGFVLGMLVSARIRYHKLKPVRVFFSEQRFREGFYNVIQPDDKQKETIENLLSKYARSNGTIQNEFRKKIDSTMKEFWKELEPALTKEQLDRLKELEQRRIEMLRQGQKSFRDSSDSRDRDKGRHRMPPPPHRDGSRFREKPDSSGLQENVEKVVK